MELSVVSSFESRCDGELAQAESDWGQLNPISNLMFAVGHMFIKWMEGKVICTISAISLSTLPPPLFGPVHAIWICKSQTHHTLARYQEAVTLQSLKALWWQFWKIPS